MGNRLKNKVAFITGGGRGIGQVIAEKYAAEGCHLALAARSKEELELTAKKIIQKNDVQIKTYPLDVSDEKKVEEAVHNIVHSFGRIDILVNNAGIVGPLGPLEKINTEEWEKTIRINLGGTFHCTKAVIPHMKEKKWGRIINMAGGGVFQPAPFMDAYAVTKIAIVRLTENLALELKDSGITVVVMSPGGVNTRMFDDMLNSGEEAVGSEIWKSFLARQKAGGDSIDTPAELALFLASDEAKVVNGRLIGAKWDKWNFFEKYKNEIATSDIYTLRRILPKDRGFNW